jgi:hypothetical protein
MAIAPKTKREADLVALTLFCVFSFILKEKLVEPRPMDARCVDLDHAQGV